MSSPISANIEPSYESCKGGDISECLAYKDIQINKCAIIAMYHLEYIKHSGISDCPSGGECPAYKRLKEGGLYLTDRCHMQVLKHPPRNPFVN